MDKVQKPINICCPSTRDCLLNKVVNQPGIPQFGLILLNENC